MLMETAYRLVGCLGSVFGIYENEKEAMYVNELSYKGNMKVEKYQIPYCIYIELFNQEA